MKRRRDNEVIGKLHSTFVQWSSLLSNSSMVRLCTINDAHQELFMNDDNYNNHNNSTDHPLGISSDNATNTTNKAVSLPLPPPKMKVINHYVIDDRQIFFGRLLLATT